MQIITYYFNWFDRFNEFCCFEFNYVKSSDECKKVK